MSGNQQDSNDRVPQAASHNNKLPRNSAKQRALAEALKRNLQRRKQAATRPTASQE
jgi:hypothetical protein